MRLFIDGPFDIGAVYGVADEAFSKLDRKSILRSARRIFGDHVERIGDLEESKAPTADHLQTTPSDTAAPFGDGLRFRVTAGPLLDHWRADALLFLETNREELAAEYGAEGLRRIEALLQSVPLEEAGIFLFGVGVGLLRLSVGPFDLEDPSLIRGLFKTLEVGGYGEIVRPQSRPTANALLAAFRSELRAQLAKQTPSSALTDRKPSDALVEIRGF